MSTIVAKKVPVAVHNVRVVYVLRNTASRGTYVGWTNNAPRRLRQHNGELVGGSNRTSGWRATEAEKGHWAFAAHVRGFESHFSARSFEAYMHCRRNRLIGRCRKRTPVASKLAKAEKLIAAYPHKFGHLEIVLFDST
jgi:hypothetical protein